MINKDRANTFVLLKELNKFNFAILERILSEIIEVRPQALKAP
jgi:hypothetical protein